MHMGLNRDELALNEAQVEDTCKRAVEPHSSSNCKAVRVLSVSSWWKEGFVFVHSVIWSLDVAVPMSL